MHGIAPRGHTLSSVQITKLKDATARPRRIAVGMFDGVHLGHREVIGDSDSVLTFDPHPSAVIAPQHTPRLLTPLPLKAELIAELGVEELIVIEFDRDFAAQEASRFIDEVLVTALDAQRVSVGENFRFGHKAQGDPALLTADPRFQTRVVPLLEVGEEVVSSSHIRGLVAAGDVAGAARLLGGPFELRGVVVEVHIIDFDGDLYGSELRLQFIERLRGERRFDSAAELIEAMGRDVERARELCYRWRGHDPD